MTRLISRVAEGEGLFVGGAQEVEGEPLRGPLADARQARELGDQARQRCRAFAQPSRPPMPPRSPPAMPPIFELASS